MALSLRTEHLARYRDVARLLVRYGRSDLVSQAGLDDLAGPEPHADPKGAEELAADLEALGPTYIKLGQLLSTRPDLIPAPYAEALERLQDSVEPFGFDEVERIVSDELGVRISKGFASFDETPMASASLGQVHRARMRDGREVAVKVQRPGVRERVAADMAALAELARFADEHLEAGRRYGFADLLAQFRRSLAGELDYRREAANLRNLGRILRPYDRLVVPDPVPDFTTARVLTMDYVPGRKVTDLGPLARLELDGSALAEQLFQAYLDQILVEGFFHADPHPGNVLLTPDGRLALVDLGMVARIVKGTRQVLARLLVAVSEGDGRASADALVALGRPLDWFDRDGFCAEASRLVEESRDLTLDQVEAGSLVLELMRISGLHGLRLPAELSMLGKALLNLDRVAATLDPGFEPVAAIRSHSRALMEEQIRTSPGSAFAMLVESRDFVEKLPGRLNKVMDSVADGRLELKVRAFDQTEMMQSLHTIANRLTMGIVLAALIVGAAMLVRIDTPPTLLGYPAVAIVCFLAAAGGGLALLVSIVRGDRRAGRGR